MCVAPAAQGAGGTGFSLLTCRGQSQGRHPVIEHQGLLGMSVETSHVHVTCHLELQEADVIDLGVALKLWVADNPLQVPEDDVTRVIVCTWDISPGLLLVLPVDELDAPGHNVQGSRDHFDAAAGGSQHPVLVNHGAAAEVGDAQTPDQDDNQDDII